MFRFWVAGFFAIAGLSATVDARAECAWPGRTGRDSFNVAFPDTSSTYWSHVYRLAEGASIEISGGYAAGRYFSLNTYSLTGDSIDSLADVEIAPEPGSHHPFLNPGATVGESARWRVQLQSAAQPVTGSNALAGTKSGRESGWGVLIYRVYVPNDPADEKGGVPLPEITKIAGGERETLAACENPGGSFAAEAVIRLFGPRADLKPRAQPVFGRPINSDGFFPNRDNKYLAALTEWKPGRLVVVRGRAPTTPDTRRGDRVTGPYQMRYWSVCTNEYRQPWPVNHCVADMDIARNAAGEFTLVISTAEDRPTGATKENGITWLEWGPTRGVGLIVLRHMLPAPGFQQAAQNVKPGESGARVMGPYAPVGRYCSRSAFESRGLKGCGF